jgi:type II secretory pathway component PulF
MSNNPNPLSYAPIEKSRWRQHEPREWFGWLLSRIGSFFAGLFLLAALAGILALATGSGGAGWLAIGALLVASFLSATLRVQRRYRAYRIFSYLQQAIRCHLPLPPMLAAAAQSETGVLRARLNRLNFALHDGASLPDAVAMAVPEATQRHVSMLHAATRNGDLARTLEQLIIEHQQYTHQHTLQSAFMRVYFVIVLTGIGFVGWLLMIFVMPKFQQILRDFGMTSPWAMRQFLMFSPTTMMLMTIAGYLLLGWLLGVIGHETTSARLRRWSPLRATVDYVRWFLPVLGGQDRDGGLADVFEVLATATEKGRPLSAAAIEAANLHLNSVLQSRVTRFADAIASGTSLGQAAHNARLPALAKGLLASAQSAGNVPETFRFLQTYYASRFSRVGAILRAAALPTVAIVMGAFVLFIALSIFTPLLSFMGATDPWSQPL